MPDTRECDFCGADIEPGTGTMFVRKNGATVNFCSAKCEKNADLGREARDLNWTEAGRESDRRETAAADRESARSAAADEAAAEDDAGAAPDLDAAEAEVETDAESVESGDETATDDADEESDDVGDETATDDADEESDDSDTEAEEAEA